MNDREVRFLHEWIIQTYPNTMSLKMQKQCNKQLSTDNLVDKYLGTSKVMINISYLLEEEKSCSLGLSLLRQTLQNADSSSLAKLHYFQILS